MASQVFLQQALFTPNQFSSTKLGFSSSLSAFTLGSRNTPLISGVSSISISWRCSPMNARPSFVVRAESNLDAASENVDEVPEAGAEAEEQVSDSDPAVAVEEEEQLKPPRKPRVKLGDIMGILNKRAIEASDKVRPTPEIRTGDIVEIKLEVPENKRRLSIYKGIVISKQNAGIHTTIRIRRIIAGTGVEIVFPIYSPNIKEIKVVNHRKVRRARLYYLRDKLPRFSTFK